MKCALISLLLLGGWWSAGLGDGTGTYPFVLSVTPWEGGVLLHGSLPEREQLVSLEAAVKEALGEGRVVSRLKVSPQTTREPWVGTLPGLVAEFLSGWNGRTELSIVDGKIILQGDLDSRGRYVELRERLQERQPAALEIGDRLRVGGKRMVPGPVIEIAAALPSPPGRKAKATASSEPRTAPVSAETRKVAKGLGAIESRKVDPDPESEPHPEPRQEPAAVVKAASEPKPERILASEPGPDPGGPVLFYFDTGSSEIRSEDRHQVDWIIARCQRPRTIVYITGYADFRGSYELNRKLTIQRTENVRDAIFAGNVAEDLKAELEAKGDAQSEKRDSGRSKPSEKSLQHSRRVVVETYHLK